MKRIIIYGNLLLLLFFVLSSCNVVRITADFSEKQVPKADKMVLISTFIGKIEQPVIPLIDAAGFNKKTNEIADEIMDMQEKYTDKFRENISSNIKKYFNCEVLSGESLQALNGFNELKENYNFTNNLFIENDNFPKMHIATGDINPFKFEKGKVIQYFKSPDNYKSTVIDLCKNLGVDIIAVSFSQLNVYSVSAFGITGALKLDSYLYIFDKEGDLVATGKAFSKFSNIKGKEVSDYQMKIEDFSILSDPLCSKTAEKFTSNL